MPDKPKFDVSLCARYVESLLVHDEVERALLVLANVPAYYRDHMPAELRRLRDEILTARYTAATYVASPNDSAVSPEHAVPALRFMVRGRLVESEVRRYNERGVTPHIIEMGPGTYFIPMALAQLGLRFTYWDLALNAEARRLAAELPRQREPGRDQPVIFLALEIIEHLADTAELAIEALKHSGGSPHRVHLSTPLYTYDTAHENWRTGDGLPHLRAYTPREFCAEAQRLFPGYHWDHISHQIMSLRGCRSDVADAEPLTL